ncbi:Sporulation thiol-disulfide oxidoreductase A [Meiothermus luteus]|uniref:Sporulation thiol-disulfide oxidoreductase A n=1 Tax=Meiothermus luteus TaxID=2026184 RepID=A0A399EJT2_9DEIN|nr:TlpA disulfide reductase family protein [Meiothermus luteus]RIH82421.1 Sporulation thiol-disulfide oxidoreductase A [Meiothermus luteus]RMH55516.1 MAG: TlpA family protein disulfide reductase [Deinococcota bacterium]
MEKTPIGLSPRLRLGLVGLIAGGLVLLALFATPPRPPTGDLPQATLVRLDGTPVRLQSGKPTVLTVWATWCGYCQRQLPEFEAAARAHPEVRFVFVNDGEPASLVRQFHDARGFTHAEVYQDALRAVAQALRVNGYPSNFFYNAQGERVGEVRGYMSPEQLRAALAQLR